MAAGLQLECPDDTVCVQCGKQLPAVPAPGTWAYEGVCNTTCAAAFLKAEALRQGLRPLLPDVIPSVVG